MSLFKSLVQNLRQQAAGKRTWTPTEVRELLQRKALDEARKALECLPEQLPDREAVRACLLGEVLFQQRDDEGALQAFRAALRQTPGSPSAHYGLSLVQAETGAFDDALRHAFFAHSVEPNEPRFVAQVGYCQLQLGNYPLAEAPLRRATLLSPQDPHVWNNLGVVLMAKAGLEEAHDCFRKATDLRPDFGSAAQNMAQLMSELRSRLGHEPGMPQRPQVECDGMLADPRLAPIHELERSGELRAALQACDDLLLDTPDATAVAIELHRLYRRAGDPGSGIDALEAFLSDHPQDMLVRGTLGLARVEMREFKRGEALLRAAVESQPDHLDFVLGLAQALAGQERFDEASGWLDTALELAPEQTGVQVARTANLVNQCRYEEALVACESLDAKGIKLAALGMVLAYLGRLEEAQSAFERTVALQPNDPTFRFHRASLRLLQLDFAGGWDDYAYRGFSNSESFRVLPLPLWKGEPLAGKRVLVLAEQGLGDQVMFASCLPDLLALAPSELVVESINRIAPTIQRSFPQCRVIATSQSRGLDWLKDCPDMDFYVPLADLPRYFRRSVESFPKHTGYLTPSPERVAHWKAKLAEAGPGPYIGFSWKGGTEGTRSKLRTMQALSFLPLKNAALATWVCLQYGHVAEQITAAREQGLETAYWPESITDLDEFAALVSALDLVVTVCNTTVHYAGALGVPVWVLAPRIPEWRYGFNNRTLPWYPSSVMYRQNEAGNWQDVIERVRRDLSVRFTVSGITS